jgi:hypothetical protein
MQNYWGGEGRGISLIVVQSNSTSNIRLGSFSDIGYLDSVESGGFVAPMCMMNYFQLEKLQVGSLDEKLKKYQKTDKVLSGHKYVTYVM